MLRMLAIAILTLSGCSLSSIPHDIAALHAKTHDILPLLQETIQPGDIVFRLGTTKVAGCVNFSKMIADMSDSDFSHAALIHRKSEDGIVILNVDKLGVERQFIQDWYITGTANLVVKRLKPQYQYLIPAIIKKMDEVVKADYLYDTSFGRSKTEYYCTEIVDEIFRSVGHPLADKIKIKDMPNYNILTAIACLMSGVNPEQKVAVAGNDTIGLFSSPMLVFVCL